MGVGEPRELAIEEIGAFARHEGRSLAVGMGSSDVASVEDLADVVERGRQTGELAVMVAPGLTGFELSRRTETAVGSGSQDREIGDGRDTHRAHAGLGRLTHGLLGRRLAQLLHQWRGVFVAGEEASTGVRVQIDPRPVCAFGAHVWVPLGGTPADRRPSVAAHPDRRAHAP